MPGAESLAKLIMLVGIASIFATLIYPTNGPGNAFQTFSNTIGSGLTLPTFINPFDSNISVFKTTMTIDNAAPCNFDGTICQSNGAPVSTVGTAGGCALATYWKCLQTQDGVRSYISTTLASAAFSVNFTANQSLTSASITSAFVTMQCRSRNASASYGGNLFFFDRTGRLVEPGQALNSPVPIFHVNPFRCPGGTPGAFANVTIDYCSVICGQYSGPASARPLRDDPTRITARIDFVQNCFSGPSTILCAGNPPTLDISFVSIAITYAYATAPCKDVTIQFFGGGPSFTVPDFACYIGHGVDVLSNAFWFFINGITFLVRSLVAIFNYIFGAAPTLLHGLINAIQWWFNIPTNDSAPCPPGHLSGDPRCVPSTIQLIVSALFIGVVGYLVYIIITLVRGVGPA